MDAQPQRGALPDGAQGRPRPRRDLGIRLIVAYKAVKSVAEVALAIALVVAVSRGDIEPLRVLARHLEHDVTARWAVLLGRALAPLVTVRGIHLVEIGLALDGVVSAVEGWSLWRRWRWGAWLVVAATGLPLPLELARILHRPTAPRILVAILNGAVVWYLAQRIAREHRARDAGA